MQRYTFEVLTGDEAITAARLVAVSDLNAVWSRIGDIAKNIEEAGRLVRVTDEAGEIVILVGAAAARLYSPMLKPAA